MSNYTERTTVEDYNKIAVEVHLQPESITIDNTSFETYLQSSPTILDLQSQIKTLSDKIAELHPTPET